MKLTLEKTKAFWIYIVGGALAMILGGMLMPVWKAFENELFFRSWGEFSVYIMISLLLFAYIFLYLIKRIKRYSTTPAQIVAIVELVLMVVIAVVCTVSAFVDFISFGEPCRVFGLAIWARGVSGVFTGYYCDSSKVSKKKKSKGKKDEEKEEASGEVDDFTVWRLVVSVAMISAGTFFFIEPLIEALTLQWLFSCTIILVGAFFLVYGLFLKPVKVKAEKPKKEVKLDETKKETELPKKEEKEELTEAPSIKISLNASNDLNETKEINAVTDTASLDAIKEEKADKKNKEDKKEEKSDKAEDKPDKKEEKADTPTALVPNNKK